MSYLYGFYPTILLLILFVGVYFAIVGVWMRLYNRRHPPIDLQQQEPVDAPKKLGEQDAAKSKKKAA